MRNKFDAENFSVLNDRNGQHKSNFFFQVEKIASFLQRNAKKSQILFRQYEIANIKQQLKISLYVLHFLLLNICECSKRTIYRIT
jgi:hypothetical protein